MPVQGVFSVNLWAGALTCCYRKLPPKKGMVGVLLLQISLKRGIVREGNVLNLLSFYGIYLFGNYVHD
jgi:hypothetical protein